MNLPDFKQPEEYRQLRVITILAFVLAAAMLLPYGAITQSALPAIGIAPMFFSAAMGILIFTGMLKSPWTKASMDGGLAVLLLIFMIPWCVAFHSVISRERRADNVTLPQHCVSPKGWLEQRRRRADARHLWNFHDDSQLVCSRPIPPDEFVLIVC